jgi:hypothetical protein
VSADNKKLETSKDTRATEPTTRPGTAERSIKVTKPGVTKVTKPGVTHPKPAKH